VAFDSKVTVIPCGERIRSYSRPASFVWKSSFSSHPWIFVLLAVVGAGDKFGLSDFRSTNADRVKQSLDEHLSENSLLSLCPIPRVLNHVPLRDPVLAKRPLKLGWR